MTRLRSRSWLVDALIVVVLFAGASWWGIRYVTAFIDSGRQPIFYQSYFEPAVMLACGRGFTVAAERPALVHEFLHQRSDRFDCASLPEGLVLDSDAVYQYPWFYLMVTVGLVWKVVGVSWSGLAPLYGVLYGGVIVLAYGLFRLAVPPWVALAPALLLTGSSLHLQNLPHLRDYAKAPFVLALVLILIWVVMRPLAARTLLGLAGLYGVILGVGYGFRTDLLANIPPFVIAVLLFLPHGVKTPLKLRLAAIAVAGVAFAGVSWPASASVVRQGGCQWHVVLLGLDDRFTSDLGVEPALYGWTPTYSDEYVHTAVNSHLHRMTGAGPVDYCSAEYDAASAAYLGDIHQRFPADVLTRAYASVRRVLDLPFYWWNTTADAAAPRRGSLGTVLTYVAGAARLAVLVAIALIGARSLRLGLFAVCVVLYFGGYPSLQFSNRHYFHLEFIGWWAMAFLGWQAVRLWLPGERGDLPVTSSDWWRLAVATGRFAAVAAAITLLPYPLALAYQHRQAQALVQSLLDAPRVELPMVVAEDGTAIHSLGSSFPETEEGVTQTAYLDVHLDLAACPQGLPLGLQYDRAASFYDFSGPVQTQRAGAVAARVLLPVYRHFQGLTLGGAPAACIARVERLASVRGVPLLPVMALTPDWSRLPWHQSIKSRWVAWFMAVWPMSRL